MSVDSLGQAGRALHAAMLAELEGEGLEFDGRESALLDRACRIADTIAELDAAIDEHGVVARGSRGQLTASPLLAERRLQELNLVRCLKAIGLPHDAAKTTAQKRSAARQRWNRG